MTDGREWLCCDKCEKWNHIDCEISASKRPNLKDLLEDKEFKYYCITCNKNRKNNNASKGKFKSKASHNNNHSSDAQMEGDDEEDDGDEEEKVPLSTTAGDNLNAGQMNLEH